MQVNESHVHVPRNLNAPPMFFIWEADIAMLWLTCIILGATMGMAPLGIMMAEISRRIYSKLKNEGGRGLMMRLLYWYTPLNLSQMGLNSEYREFYG